MSFPVTVVDERDETEIASEIVAAHPNPPDAGASSGLEGLDDPCGLVAHTAICSVFEMLITSD